MILPEFWVLIKTIQEIIQTGHTTKKTTQRHYTILKINTKKQTEEIQKRNLHPGGKMIQTPLKTTEPQITMIIQKQLLTRLTANP